MATLVLTAVGTALGGPIGGALGGLIGQSIDQGLFGPGPRKGPRLGDLSVQTSSYGSPIPRIYGAMRVAGTVIWASDLVEEEVIEGGGKGSPERTTYSYSANLAVAVSSRPIRAIKRIWADGKLIRGASGDFKVMTKFRLAQGSEDQERDPLIASMEGIANAPAYRGLALAVFEDLELAEFGNRIPLLTFEVIADDEPVPLAALLADASGGKIGVSGAMAVAGFAAHGTSVRDSLAQLVEMTGVRLVDRDGRLQSPESASPRLVAGDELGCDADGAAGTKVQRIRAPDGEMPAMLTIAYYDPERDYQSGQARASSGKGGTREIRLELPAVFAAGEVRQLAENALSRLWLAGDRFKLRLPPSHMGLQPGDAIQLANTARPWTARAVSIEGMVVAIEAEAAPVAVLPLPDDAGRPVSEPDIVVGRTQLALFELPPDGDAPAQAPLPFLAASNDGQWKSMAVELLLDGHPLPGQAIGRRSVLGQTETVLDPSLANILDERSQVVVRLANDEQILLNVDRDALMAGANLALIGDELIQFGRAEQLGAGLFRISSLLRGRRGTEWAAATHSVGDRFCMINPGLLRSVPLATSAVGADLTVVAHGIGDVAPLPQVALTVSGEAMRPPPPCHLRAVRSGADLLVQWVRRSHRLWAWTDGIGDGVDAFPELYCLTMTGPGGETVMDTANRSLLLGPSQIPGQGAIHQPVGRDHRSGGLVARGEHHSHTLERSDMDQTARFALPYLAPGQMQKELFHNEALQRIDMLLCPVVDGPASAAPPSNPVVGGCYLVAADASGAWSGQDGSLACFSEGGWRFVLPMDGMSLVDRASGQVLARRDGAWETGIVRAQELRVNGQTVVRNRQSAIGDPSGGTVVDSQCRVAVAQMLAAMRAHGLIS
ncbi:MAG: phage tail protein [Pseudomonadota bacterium]|nr:phage tail protein [Pseudomonadota bacterium]